MIRVWWEALGASLRNALRMLRAKRGSAPPLSNAEHDLIHDLVRKRMEEKGGRWESRAEMMRDIAGPMRRLIVDSSPPDAMVRRLDQGLERLVAIDRQQVEVVELRYFCGLTEEETAEALDMPLRTVKRNWVMAKAWLHGELKS